MTDALRLADAFAPLFKEIENDELDTIRPLLAHYTTIQTLEKILQTNEIWLANPLFMNDFEELRWGISHGVDEFIKNKSIDDYLSNSNTIEEFKFQLDWHLNNFEEKHAFDTYIFCLSKHELDEIDGKLSMWRAYGANGDGVAIVFNTARLPRSEESPLIIAPVVYATRERRREMLKELAERFAEILAKHKLTTRDEFFHAVYYLFERLKLLSIYTKHSGFIEEQEWRVVYMPDRDTENKFFNKRHYITNGRGVEPKLRLKFGEGEPGLHPDLKFDDLIHEIILGPSHASVLAERSIKRMMELLGREALIPKVRASTIPYRRP